MLEDLDLRRSSFGDGTEREAAGEGSMCELERMLERAIGPDPRLGVFISISKKCSELEIVCIKLTS